MRRKKTRKTNKHDSLKDLEGRQGRLLRVHAIRGTSRAYRRTFSRTTVPTRLPTTSHSGDYNFHYERQGDIVYLCMADASVGAST